MGWRRYVVFCIACLAAFAGLLYVAGHFYWGLLRANDPAGGYILFGRELPDPLGRWLWWGIKPAIFLLPAAAAFFLYRAIKLRRLVRRPGACRACGYDLRASTGRCPECGTPFVLDGGDPAEGAEHAVR